MMVTEDPGTVSSPKAARTDFLKLIWKGAELARAGVIVPESFCVTLTCTTLATVGENVGEPAATVGLVDLTMVGNVVWVGTDEGA